MKTTLASLKSESDGSKESARTRNARSRRVKPTPFWLSQNLQQREVYLKNHPNSPFQHIKHVGLDNEGNPTTRDSDQQREAGRKTEAQKKAIERLKRKREREEKAKEAAKKARGTETTEQRDIRQSDALTESSWRKGAAKLATKGTMFAGKLSRSLTPRHEAAIEKFFQEKFKKKPEDETPVADEDVDQELIIDAVKPLARVLLSAALVGVTLAGGGLVVAAIAAAYTNGAFTLPEFLSESSSELDTSDPVQFLVHDFTRWSKSIDMRKVSGLITEMIETQRTIEGKGGNADLVSTSAAASLRIVPCPSHRKTDTPITRYLVKIGTKQIGRIHSDKKIDGDSPNNRCWVSTLNDGFSETGYATGVSREAPFTLATTKGVLLRNPQRQTLEEAKAWVRSTVNKGMV